MPTFDITERVVSYLSIPSAAVGNWTNTNFNFDYAIGGVPFIAAINDIKMYLRSPYKRSFTQVRRDQVDQQPTPGEQSLTGWWLRSQSNWTGGAGVKYFEPATDDRVMRSFRDSLGVDCWTLGQLSLLNSTTVSTSTTGRSWPVSYSGGNATYYISGSASPTILRGATPTTLTGTGTPLSVTDDGTNFYRLTTTGLYKGTIASGGDSSLITTAPTPTTGVVSWVKQRLMFAYDHKIYELGSGVIAALPASPMYAHPNTSWIWSAICDGPAAIYASGYAGSRSSIYKFALDSTLSSNSLPAVGRGTVAAELPTGEIVNSIATYLGKYMAVCTNKGVRVAVIDGNGDLTYGPLIWTDSATYCAFGSDRFFYVGGTLSNGAGLIRIDLSDPDQQGRFPYATDLQSGIGSGYVTNICQIGIGQLKSFTTFDSTNSYRVDETTTKVSSGWIRGGLVRYSTLEPKHFELVSLRWAEPMPVGATIGITAISNDLSERSIISVGSGSDQQVDIGWPNNDKAIGQGLRLDLYRATDTTTGPTVQGWQFKAVPASSRKELIEIPLMCFDFVRDRYQTQIGYEGYAIDSFNLLKSQIIDGAVVAFQDLATGESVQVVVEDFSFEQVTPPGIAAGFGGLLTLQMRQV